MIAWFDIFSGISGDMTLGAFVDLGVPVDWLRERLTLLPIEKFDLKYKNVLRNGIKAVNFFVEIDDHVHGNNHIRNYREIKKIIAESKLSERVKALSFSAFEKIAAAESEIHGQDIDDVHFHEVGAIDCIVDIVGSFSCVDFLKITEVYASAIPLGKGFVKCCHGTLPVPAPAVVSILKGIPVKKSSIEMELVTPTGAAIIATLASDFGPMPDMIIDGVGYGSGKNENNSDIPNLLRIVAGTKICCRNLTEKNDEIIKDKAIRNEITKNAGFKVGTETQEIDKNSIIRNETISVYGSSVQDESLIIEDIFVVETSIDDMIPEISGYLMEKLFENGALDVCHIPVQMKKNRPGIRLEVLCLDGQLKNIINLILDETTTIGVRFHKVKRVCLKRKKISIDTRFGKIKAKEITGTTGKKRIAPEYEECRSIAAMLNMPLRDVYTQVCLDMNHGKIYKK